MTADPAGTGGSVSGATTELTWVGHATVLIDVGGYRVITDPVLTRRVAHLRRRRPLPNPAVADVDLILLSHVHMDHLHLPSLRRIRRRAKIVTPAGSGPLLTKAGFRDVTEVEVGDQLVVDPVSIDVVPAVHKDARGPHSKMKAQPVGYAVDVGNSTGRVYFAGDTDLFDGMRDLDDIEVALLPIWGWGSSLGIGHLDPMTAVEATRLIQPRFVVPIHWGTYAPEDGRRRIPTWFDDPIGRFAAELTDADEVERLRVLQPGGSLMLTGG